LSPVLTFVLYPRIDQEDLQPSPSYRDILEEAPAVRPIPLTFGPDMAHRLKKLPLIAFGDMILNGDKHRASVIARFFGENGFRPMHERR
jgi:hypothetical protein